MKLFLQIIGGILGIFLADKIVPGVTLKIIPGKSVFFGLVFTHYWHILFLVGGVLGLINYFLKPLLKLITLPLKVLTLGIFGIILNMGIIWVLDVLFPELDIIGIVPLFFTTLICWGINFILGLYHSKARKFFNF